MTPCTLNRDDLLPLDHRHTMALHPRSDAIGLVHVGLSPEQRARLSHKGRLLYARFCGTDRRGIRAESFALYHIGRGELEVARDLLAFLDAEIELLRATDLQGRLDLAEGLAASIRAALATERDKLPEPACGRQGTRRCSPFSKKRVTAPSCP